jgi:hypothetical protein
LPHAAGVPKAVQACGFDQKKAEVMPESFAGLSQTAPHPSSPEIMIRLDRIMI